jgi:hypothetical protein
MGMFLLSLHVQMPLCLNAIHTDDIEQIRSGLSVLRLPPSYPSDMVLV